MSIKLKALGLGVLAVLAMSAFAAMSATAETGGHFTSEVHHTTIVGSENTTHTTLFSVDGGTQIKCLETSYHGTTDETTETEVTITPTYKTCTTVGASHHTVTVHTNKCDFLFKVGKSAPTQDNTVEVACSGAPAYFEITHPNCTIRVPAQSAATGLQGGVAYTTITKNNKHALTADVTVSEIAAHYEGGICVFLGTNHKATMNGSVTLEGRSGANPVNITATGSDNVEHEGS